ncbi:phage major capsid protein [Kineococcus gynurae]|uniref:Phage major capsid protein n=1 Tax=Kineococcus gynurae TaxID=452979 RepID=A0ABV5LWX8_9ACTN
MNERLRRLLEQRATAWAQVQDIRERLERENRDLTTEENETYERGLADVERLSQDIEREERAERQHRLVDDLAPDNRSTPPRSEDPERDSGEEYRDAFGRYLRRGLGRLSGEEQDLLQRGFVDSPEMRAQGVGNDAAGGYTVPEEFLRRMTEALRDFGGILSVVEVMNTSTGADIRWPTSDETNSKGALLDENTQVTEQDLLLGTTKLGAFTYTSKIVRVSLQLLQDTAFDLETWLPKKLGERIGRASSEHFAVGDGVNKPQGLFTALGVGKETASATTIKYDDLVDLEHSVDPAYRQGGRARYLLSDTGLAAIRKIKDDQGRPLWSPALAEGVPSTINGRPYTIDNNIASFAAGAKPIAFGDFNAAYVARIVAGAQTLRLTERYADFLQVGFLGFQRMDGRVNDATAAKALKLKAA